MVKIPKQLEDGITVERFKVKLQQRWLEKRSKNIFSQPLTEEQMDEKSHYLYRQYWEWMQSEFGEYHTKKQLKAMDTIDVTNIGEFVKGRKMIDIIDEIRNYPETTWYDFIPPLKEGVMKISNHRWNQFETLKIDEEKQTVTIGMTDYCYESGVMSPEDSSVFIIKPVKETDEESTGFSVIAHESVFDIMMKNNPDELKWSADDRLYFDEVVMPSLGAIVMESKNEYMQNITCFVTSILITNYMLMKNKPRAVRGKKGSGGKVTCIPAPENERKKQIVRRVGDVISIKSAKMPRRPTGETIRKYKVAAWNSRGHVRHYKSGKTVYVRPSVHHRKCFKENEELAQTILKVGNTKKAEVENGSV